MPIYWLQVTGYWFHAAPLAVLCLMSGQIYVGVDILNFSTRHSYGLRIQTRRCGYPQDAPKEHNRSLTNPEIRFSGITSVVSGTKFREVSGCRLLVVAGRVYGKPLAAEGDSNSEALFDSG